MEDKYFFCDLVEEREGEKLSLVQSGGERS